MLHSANLPFSVWDILFRVLLLNIVIFFLLASIVSRWHFFLTIFASPLIFSLNLLPLFQHETCRLGAMEMNRVSTYLHIKAKRAWSTVKPRRTLGVCRLLGMKENPTRACMWCWASYVNPGHRLDHPDEPLVPSEGVVTDASVRASDLALPSSPVCCTCGCTDVENVFFFLLFSSHSLECRCEKVRVAFAEICDLSGQGSQVGLRNSLFFFFCYSLTTSLTCSVNDSSTCHRFLKRI